MITETTNTSNVLRLKGTMKLVPIETMHIPNEVKVPYDERGDVELFYYAAFYKDSNEVTITIGDYIVCGWTLGEDDYKFTNDKGYGLDHWMSFINDLPINIAFEVATHIAFPKHFNRVGK